MKKFFSVLLAGLLFAAVSCEPEEDGSKLAKDVSVEVLDYGQTTATVCFDSKTMDEIAYLLVTGEDRPTAVSASFIFYEGETVAPGEEVSFTSLHPMTTYYLYVAARAAGSYTDSIIIKDFTTTDTEEDFELLAVDYDGFTMSMRLPKETEKRGNVIRYKFNSLYNYNHFVTYGAVPDKYEDHYLLEWNTGLRFGDKESRMTLEVNKDTEYLRDEDGELVTDELTGELVQIHQPIAPGEPIVFLAGEFTKAGQEDYDDDWRKPLYDETEKKWTGFFKRMVINAKAPEVLDGEVTIEQLSVGAVDAVIRLTPSENVKQYCVWIVEDEEYKTIHLPRLGNREELVQWFVTSYDAGYFAGTMTFNSPVEISLMTHAYDNAQPETDYHIFVTAGNEDFSAQSFKRDIIHTTSKTLPAPELIVTAIDAPAGEKSSPYEVWFNVKCTTKDAVKGYYAANYIGPWIQEYNSTKSHAEIIQMGSMWDSAEIAQINSDEGYNVSFGSLEGMTTRLGVMVYNIENTPNEVDVENSTAMADGTTGVLSSEDKVDSPLFDALTGDWTMTAKAVSYNWGMSRWNTKEEVVNTKIRISAGVEYPLNLSEDVYNTYAEKEAELGISRDEVTQWYENFKTESSVWNARLRGQNRLLCFGFNSAMSDSRDLDAYGAFCDFDYVSYDNVAILHDFGPKWYLQIDGLGNITAPFNSALFAPMSAHYYYEQYFAGVSKDDLIVTAGLSEDGGLPETLAFPVTMPDDDTIIIHPLKLTPEGASQEVEYYPNSVTLDMNNPQPILGPKYVSVLTLTRGWADGTAAASPAGRSSSQKLHLPSRKALTSFEGAVVYEKVDYILK